MVSAGGGVSAYSQLLVLGADDRGVGSASAAGVKTNAKVKHDAVKAAIGDDTFISMIVPVP
ncbi:hypothetical protein CULCOIPH002_05120 [Corynebacterium ulcerans]|uniref:Uncharacterized protein n=1 Tax=Corynebacterium ulcerans TaxID=65058 RepID=A0ABD0BI72_CORUL|nr:hypothetical protein CULCOIPH001_01200 [Corynebacterium ulcerans]GJJ35600.1 hypothetical protein CULCOIPH002_05120 [Corynebacterium ulcerans]GJJ39145.1 hypothetical protein CULCOIPH003_17760 [Corynebacterium ulcerans]GJJ39709.1 hypothetical protein CULCOIPH004_01200 [Corynebacterium ulcerans]GJJ42480.1 hypothetical protein CULCOIPH005_06690 [Corynebacterium ulcerans]